MSEVADVVKELRGELTLRPDRSAIPLFRHELTGILDALSAAEKRVAELEAEKSQMVAGFENMGAALTDCGNSEDALKQRVETLERALDIASWHGFKEKKADSVAFVFASDDSMPRSVTADEWRQHHAAKATAKREGWLAAAAQREADPK